MNHKVEIYTDGSCLGNPGPGGWAALLRSSSEEKVIFGQAKETTNNRMELTGAIEALQTLTQQAQVKLVTDSQYLRLGMTQWVEACSRGDGVGQITSLSKMLIYGKCSLRFQKNMIFRGIG